MKIYFFEEFATAKNLSILKKIKFKTKLFVTANSLASFSRIKVPSNIEKVYWPTFSRKEGYWLSPFSSRKALLRMFKELKDKKVPVMLDLELPTRQNFWLYFSQGFNFFRNKKLFTKFISTYRGEMYAAEYGIMAKWLKWLGLHFDYPNLKIIKMWYNSIHPYSTRFFVSQIKKAQKKFGSQLLVTVGVLGVGINGTEKDLTFNQFKYDLKILDSLGIKEVVIFRLGGLKNKHLLYLNSLMT